MKAIKSARPDDRRPQRGDRSAFSFVEIIIVLAILGILLAIGLPSYLNYASNQRVRTTAQVLASDLHVARQEAVTRRATVAVTFATADSACAAQRNAAAYTITQASTVIKRTCLPADVAWVSLPQGSLQFQSTGAARAGMTLRVRSARTGTTYSVFVAGETGVITDDAP